MWLTFAGLVLESQDGAWDTCERREPAHSFGGGAWHISKLFWSRFQQLPHWPGYTDFLQGKFGPSTIDALPVLSWPPFLRFFVSKECGPYVVTPLKWTSIFEWNMTRPVLQEWTPRRFGLCAQYMDTILGSIVWRSYVIIQRGSDCSVWLILWTLNDSDIETYDNLRDLCETIPETIEWPLMVVQVEVPIGKGGIDPRSYPNPMGTMRLSCLRPEWYLDGWMSLLLTSGAPNHGG